MQASEVELWKCFMRADPFGHVRDDDRAALSTALALTPYARKGRPFNIDDFKLRYRMRPAESKREMTPNELKEKVKAIFMFDKYARGQQKDD